MIELPIFKCRASAAGMLMTNPRNKNEVLSETTKTYVHEWLKENIYGVKKQISSKEINKGIEFEDMAIDKAIEWLDLPFAIKNDKRFEDDFFTGEPDLILPNSVHDIKNSWDAFTFPLFDKKIPTKGYEYQVQVYMHLTGLKTAFVDYVLLNTPETPWSMEIDYTHLDKKFRIKSFEFTYDPAIIEKLQERVLFVREYIKELISTI